VNRESPAMRWMLIIIVAIFGLLFLLNHEVTTAFN
jgi:hypothetical protein